MARKLPEAAKRTQFKKGQPSANPLGGKLHNPEIKLIKRLTEKELAEVATVILQGRIGDLKNLMKNPDTSPLQGMVAGLALKTMTRGDASAFNALMDRILGKVKDNVNVSGTLGTNVTGTSRVIISLPSNNREPNK